MRRVCSLIALATVLLAVGALFAFAGQTVETAMTSLNSGSVAATEKPVSHELPPPPDPDKIRQGGDVIASALPFSTLPYSDGGTTAGYVDDYNEVCAYTPVGAPDVVYVYQAGSSGFIDIVLCNSTYDTKVYVYENTYTPGSPLACNDDTPGCGPSGYRSTLLAVPVVSGSDYFIVVDGYDAASSGAYTLEVSAGTDPTGGCCMPTNTCTDLTQADCLAAGGDYLGDGTACLGDNNGNGQDDACEDPCPLGTMFSQPVMPPEGVWSAGVSDIGNTDLLKRYEKFTDVADDILGALVWGIRAYHDGSAWSECSETPMPLEVQFWTDVAGAPGTMSYGETIQVTPVATSMLYSGFTLYEFEMTLTTPVSMAAGWVSVQGVGSVPTCWFLWMNASSGLDATHILETLGTPATVEYDNSLCILGEPPTPTGACCFMDGSCAELEEADCESAGGVYEGDGTSCATTDCPIMGACCTPTDCYDLSQTDCSFVPGGVFKMGEPCSSDPCGCCVDITGNVNCDPAEDIDISDLTLLVNHLFVTFEALCCPEEANIDGDPLGGIDISDLTALVNFLFVPPNVPPFPCM